MVHVDRLVDVNWLVEVYGFLDLNINGFLYYLWGAHDFHLYGDFLLDLNDFLYYPLRTLNVFWHLDPDLYWFLNYNLFNRLFWCSSVLVLELFLEHLNLFLEFIIVPLQSVDDLVMIMTLLVSFLQALYLKLKFMPLFLRNPQLFLEPMNFLEQFL
jgi:hypothetical protein